MPKPVIQLVVAYSDNRVIGRDNALPWRLPSDLAHFKRSTMGQPIIMGRNTWVSLGRPLPGRQNVVISRNPDYRAEGATVCPSLDAALDACGGVERVSVIGGEQIFVHALPLADHLDEAAVGGKIFFVLLNVSRDMVDALGQHSHLSFNRSGICF